MRINFKDLFVIATLSLAFATTGCKSTPKTQDAPAADAAVGSNTPAVENTPMSFDAAGSDSGKIDGLTTVHFAYDKSALTSETKKQIQGNVEWMKTHANVTLQIEGHCDMKGSTEYNLSLGERRAKAVRVYMESLGIAKNRLNIISYGKEKPIAKGDSEADMAKNRRANFVPLN